MFPVYLDMQMLWAPIYIGLKLYFFWKEIFPGHKAN